MIFTLLAAAALQVPGEPVVVISPAETAIDPAAVAEAARLLEAEGFEEQLLRSAALNVEASFALMVSNLQKQSGEVLPEGFVKALRQLLLDHAESTIRAKMGAIKGQAAAIYAQEFTRNELMRLRQIASDPVMVKARERMKVIEPKFMALGMQMMRESEAELEAKINRLASEFEADRSASRTGT